MVGGFVKFSVNKLDQYFADNNAGNNNKINKIIIIIDAQLIFIIYTYLLETIQKFMITWYGKNIILNINNTRSGIKLNGLSEYKFKRVESDLSESSGWGDVLYVKDI